MNILAMQDYCKSDPPKAMTSVSATFTLSPSFSVLIRASLICGHLSCVSLEDKVYLFLH